MNNGTIRVLGDMPTELRCPYGCDGGDVTVDSKTGKCKICGRVYNIEPTQIIVGVFPDN